MSWLDQHLEEFVRPHLGKIPSVPTQPTSNFTPKLCRALRAVWEQAKKRSQGRTILLAGRDVFLFEALARMQGDRETIFRPDISALTATLAGKQTNYKEHYLLDTGYSGSVPRHLGMVHWDLIACQPAVASAEAASNRLQHQVFPGARMAYHKLPPAKPGSPYRPVVQSTLYSLASSLEGVPKYWTRAYIDPTNHAKICQMIETDQGSFSAAAKTTLYVIKQLFPETPKKFYYPGYGYYLKSMGRGV